MKGIRLPNDFVPRAYQLPVLSYFEGGGKRAITIWHRRAGKDLSAMHLACCRSHMEGERGVYWHFFPLFERARRSIWEGFRRDGVRLMENVFPGFLQCKEMRKPAGVCKRINDSEMVVELQNGSIWRLMGSDKVESVGAGPKGVVFSEYAQCKPTAWDLVRPMLRESRGWAWFITTPRGKNHAYNLYSAAQEEGSGWFHDLKTVRETNLTYASNRYPDKEIAAEEMMAEERAEGMEEALIRQEYLCDFYAAQVGSIYGELMEILEKAGNINAIFPLNTDEVFTAWDLGRGDKTAIWFFSYDKLTRGVRFIDYYENFGKGLKHYFDILDLYQSQSGGRHYNYVRHFLPHDARARTLVSEVSILDQFIQKYGSGRVDIVPQLSREDGIAAARRLLQRDILFSPRCAEGVAALTQYHYEYDEEKRAFSKDPAHDWASDAADAFRYASLIIETEEKATRPRPKPGLIIIPPKGFYETTLDELFRERESRYRR